MIKIILILILSVVMAPTLMAAAEEAHASPAAAGGERALLLTLELQQVDILDVFKILSKRAGLNIVAGKGVQGQVSIFLQDVPVREALKTILESQGLASHEENDVIKVMSESDYQLKFGRPYGDQRIHKTFTLKHSSVTVVAAKLAEVKTPQGKIIPDPRTNSIYITELPEIMSEMEQIIRQIDQPQEVGVFRLRYASAEDIEETLKAMLKDSAGQLEIDSRSNRIIITDIPSRLEKLADVIDALDVQVPQVLIEAKIVEVRLNDNFRQGINWEHVATEVAKFKTLTAAAPLLVSPPTGASALSTLALGSGSDETQVVLDLLERVGKTNLLSSPRLTVMNAEEAKLAVATRQPFVSQTVVQTATSTNTADNVEFVDVGVTLKVLPRISYDDFVEMKIKPEISSSGQAVELEGVASGSNTTFTRTRIPVVTTQELETTVQVKSGTTLVIGGLIQDRQGKASSKVPILGSLPVIGNLFKSKEHDFDKTELVMFLTPTILYPAVSTQETARFFDAKNRLLSFDALGDYSYDPSTVNPKKLAIFGSVPYWADSGSDHAA